MPDQKPEKLEIQTDEELRQLVERARQGDRAVLPKLREYLDGHPEVWQQFGDLSSHVRESWLDLIAGEDLFLRECVSRRAAALQADLEGDAPHPLIQLLAGRVVSAWLQVDYWEGRYAQTDTNLIKALEFLQKRMHQAHQRYLAATKALVAVKTLLLETGHCGPEAPAVPGGPDTAEATVRFEPGRREADQAPVRVGGRSRRMDGHLPCRIPAASSKSTGG
jgi:hypothetical protein